MPARIIEETMRLDDDLFRQVTDQLQKRCDDRINNLRITVDHHGLILQGHARTHYGKQMAQEVAKSVLGLVIVRNEIEVP